MDLSLLQWPEWVMDGPARWKGGAVIPCYTDLSYFSEGRGLTRASYRSLLEDKHFVCNHKDILYTYLSRTPRLGKDQVHSSLCALLHTLPSTVLSAGQDLFLLSETTFVLDNLKHQVSNSCMLDLFLRAPLIRLGFCSLLSRNFYWSDEERI